ncbi:MAG TPA: hypothetical protein VHM02_01650 [Thermoanaerobaculia bacterium]|nr:hypothetical protein [Thermoanaerobaculia bacterium]
MSNLALSLCDCERFAEAAEVIAAHDPLYRQQRGARWRVKESVLRGRVACGLGRSDEAEELFRAARDGALALEDYFSAALASLDLATLYLEQRRLPELREVASLLAPALDAHDLRQEAIAALLLFTRAAFAEELTVEAVRRLRWSLESGGRTATQPAPAS